MISKTGLIFVRILLPFSMGIALFYYLTSPTLLSVLWGANILFFILLITFNILYKKWNIYWFKWLIGPAIFFQFFLLGGLFSIMNKQNLKKDFYGNLHSEYLKVWINDEPQVSKGTVRFKAEIIQVYNRGRFLNARGKLLISVLTNKSQPASFKYGDILILPSDFSPVEPPGNPAEFNFKAWLASQNIYFQSIIRQDRVLKISGSRGNYFKYSAINLREKQIRTFRKLIKNNEAFAVASTLILGYRADLEKETLTAYSTTGVIHALSVSGMHVGIIYLVCSWILSLIGKRSLSRLIKVLITILLIWFYALITGMAPSILRAAIMLSIYIIAKNSNKSVNNYNVLGFTAFSLLAYNPFILWDVGFQLSFLAVLGLILIQPPLYRIIYIKNGLVNQLWKATTISIAAQITTLPFILYYFHQFPTYFIIGNLFILLPVTILLPMGLIILFGLHPLAPLLEWLLNFTNSGLKWIAALPGSQFSSIWLNRLEFTILCFVLTALIYALMKYSKKMFLVATGLYLIFEASSFAGNLKSVNQKKIIFFSLTKNYAAAFIKGNEAVLVTDLKPDQKAYEYFIKPALDQNKVKRTSLIVWKQDTIINNFQSRNHQISFWNYNLLLLDNRLGNKQVISNKLFQTIWLHNNPGHSTEELSKLGVLLLIDATNSHYTMRRCQSQSINFGLKTHILKKNKAYLIDLNKQK